MLIGKRYSSPFYLRKMKAQVKLLTYGMTMNPKLADVHPCCSVDCCPDTELDQYRADSAISMGTAQRLVQQPMF
uniref:Uncharacterized protein n=1 Tax=Setaria italica TaxID=4555 RepID=K3YKL3_SETIT